MSDKVKNILTWIAIAFITIGSGLALFVGISTGEITAIVTKVGLIATAIGGLIAAIIQLFKKVK